MTIVVAINPVLNLNYKRFDHRLVVVFVFVFQLIFRVVFILLKWLLIDSSFGCVWFEKSTQFLEANHSPLDNICNDRIWFFCFGMTRLRVCTNERQMPCDLFAYQNKTISTILITFLSEGQTGSSRSNQFISKQKVKSPI